MNLSTRMRYGSRVMAQLAGAYGQQTLSAAELASAQNLSAKYLEQILAVLRAAGFIRSVRGVGGGYHLTRPPEDIRMIELFETLEGPVALVECVAHPRQCKNHSWCVTRGLWSELTGALTDVLKRTTLEDLAMGKASRLPAPSRVRAKTAKKRRD